MNHDEKMQQLADIFDRVLAKHEENMQKLTKIFNNLLEVADVKGRDYSGVEDAMSNFHDFGTLGMVARIGDKYHRAKNIVKTGKVHGSDESLRDTLEDACLYNALAMIELATEQQQEAQCQPRI